ncbi:hypothetical protein vseg_009041 [Gypsophila vaccaria]
MGRKDKKSAVDTTPPPPPPPPPTTTTTTSSATLSSSSTSSAAPLPTASPPSSSPSSSSDTSPPPPPPPPPTTTATTKQPRSKPLTATAPAPAKLTTLALPASSAKRGSQSSARVSSKRAKKDPLSSGGGTPGKVLFQRLWSDEDEIVILKGMIEYRGKYGSDPMGNVDDFLDFIKESLQVHDANKAQIISKVRRLKKRFLNAIKADSSLKKRRISDPHELQVFELSKRIWRGPDLDESPPLEDPNKGDNGVLLRLVNTAVDLDLELGFSREEGAVLREGVRMMGGGEKEDVQRVVEKANVAYLEAYLLKLKALEIAAKKIMQGIREDRY